MSLSRQGEHSLSERFEAHLDELLGSRERPGRLLVALSGGLDSVVLLHLLRYRVTTRPLELHAAHFDHRMRCDSAEDAAWVRGLCTAWDVPLHSAAAEAPIRGELEAREARYTFLHRARQSSGAEYLLTAHHADDQAETVLFRILRGTGLSGLRGIPKRTKGGILRPLLPFWKEELERYAEASGLTYRRDPTNCIDDPARNRIRNRILPELEQSFAPAARRNLVSLAALAEESEAGWRAQVRKAAKSVIRRDGDALIVARTRLRGYHPALGSRILRKAFRRYGTVLTRIGTRSALQFITDAPSGREMQLPGGVRIRTEFDVARIERAAENALTGNDLPVLIEPLAPGDRRLLRARIGGRDYTVELTAGAGDLTVDDGWSITIPVGSASFPLRVRGRRPGDEIRTGGGTKSLKKLMIERRVPRSERAVRPVLEDSQGRLLWVPDLATEPRLTTADGERMLHLTIRDE